MSVKFTKPKGTLDVLPQESWKWQFMEEKMRHTAHIYGYREIRLPTFEATGVFSRGVGESTDIVSKEMYTFEDKAARSMTLRPEGTSGVVRCVLENGLLASSPLPLKYFYMQSCFRYENSQKGRYREFHQFGVECYGTHSPAADVEVMALAQNLLNACGLGKFVELQINTIGCPLCRKEYHQKLRKYFEAQSQSLCKNCKERLNTNPMRLLDCKEERCQETAKNAPSILDYVCKDCAQHFEEVKLLLDEAEEKYTVNSRIVRGLDYYTNTVFEFVAKGIGTQGTVCGGGRYNGLIEILGGAPTPAVGFGLGMERFLMLLEENGKLPPPPPGPVFYAISQGAEGKSMARKFVAALRAANLSAQCDIFERSVKAQMKAAGRLCARYIIVFGQEEARGGIVQLKRMHDGASVEIPLATALGILKYLHRQDPLAQSDMDLAQAVENVGPSVIFENEEF